MSDSIKNQNEGQLQVAQFFLIRQWLGRNNIGASLCSRVATSGGWGGAGLPVLGVCVVAGCRCQRNWRSPGIFLQCVRGRLELGLGLRSGLRLGLRSGLGLGLGLGVGLRLGLAMAMAPAHGEGAFCVCV